MTSLQPERELTFDVPDGWQLPSVSTLAPKRGGVESEVLELSSTYHDTAARDLLAASVTLRRRSGEADEGWQLKIPGGTADRPARTEVRLPPGPGRAVPEDLLRLTAALRRGATLRPLATLRTRRTVRRVLDNEGGGLLELVHDEVHATLHNAVGDATTWHEVEVELLDHGTEKQLAAAAGLLRKHGARPARITSKLVRAVGGPATPAAEIPGKGAAALQDYLDAQFRTLVAGDVLLRREVDVETVHATRVATRRYRSTLRVFRDLFDRDAAGRLDTELQWYAAALGEVRDRHVLRDHLLAAADRLGTGGPSVSVDAARRRIERELRAEEDAAGTALAEVMDSPRYHELLAELRTWRSAPPVRRTVGRTRLIAAADKAAATLRGRLDDADEIDPADATRRDAEYHRARKAAKRARYAAELIAPLAPSHAEKLRMRAKRWQQRLGDRQDEVVAAEFLLRLAQRPGRGAFVLGALYQQQRMLADSGQ